MKSNFAVRETEVSIRQFNLDGSLSVDASGYPRIDWLKFQREKPAVVERPHRAVVLENRFVRVTLLPEMGRVYSFVFKPTGHEQFWTNKIAKPIPALNDTGWWMVLGGIEYTIPSGEHGTTWALSWTSHIAENSARRKAVKMTVREPRTKIEQSLEISLYPDQAFYEAEITLTNPGDGEAKFSHWINPMWAPGGRGELTPNTELIVPCTAMVVLDRDFNRWMLGAHTQDFERNPLRFVKNWRDIGDLLAQQLTHGFYSAFSHDANEGIVRVFDPQVTPGMDIWTWGFPPTSARQREFGEVPNLGYVEMWGGTARDYSDEARGTLAPKTQRRWKEWMYAYHRTGGLTFANREVALNLRYDARRHQADVGIFATSPRRGVTLDLRLGRQTLLRRTMNLSPARPFQMRVSVPREHSAADWPELSVVHGASTLATTRTKPVEPLQWNFPYLPKLPERRNP